MPRTESRTKCSIWDSREWTSQPIDCQWFYLMIRSQYGVSHAGVLTIPRREWRNLAGDPDVAERVALARKICEDRNYLAIDESTDEVLIRTYIRTDIMDGPPGTFRAAMDAACAVRSPKLRAVLHAELLRLDVDKIEKKGATVHRETPLTAYHRALTALGGGPDGRRATPTPPVSFPVSPPAATPPAVPAPAEGDGIPMASGWHPDRIGDAPVDVDVAVDVLTPGGQVEINEAATRADPRVRRDAHVRAANLVGATVPRTLGNRVTRGALHTRLGERITDDVGGELTDAVVTAALRRWVDTSRVAPNAIDWMLDDAIKESRGATAVRRGGRVGTAEIFDAGRDLVSHYRAMESGDGFDNVTHLNRGVG